MTNDSMCDSSQANMDGKPLCRIMEDPKRNFRTFFFSGKMKKRIWIREGDVVLVKPWEFQSDERADIVWRYTRTEANWLERRGYLNL